MPERQTQTFPAPVDIISVAAGVTPGSRLWLDTLTVTFDDTPVDRVSWGTIRAVYR